jgi:hypothetical protein
MRLSTKQKQTVLQSCRVTRPDAKLTRRGGVWLAVWHLETDALVDPDAKVPLGSRWRAQAINLIDAHGVWWNGTEGQGKTRTLAIAEALY